VADFGQESGVAPDSGKTVLRSRVGPQLPGARNLRAFADSGNFTRGPAPCRNRLVKEYGRFSKGHKSHFQPKDTSGGYLVSVERGGDKFLNISYLPGVFRRALFVCPAR